MSISLLVVGHANTGKTSLIRTLLRQHNFGQVSDRAGTTRHVESVNIKIANSTVLTLTDTPGFEDSIGLWQIRQSNAFQTFLGGTWITAFCDSHHAQDEFEQEAKILKQLLTVDIILYVVDIRQAPLGKYLDELTLLASVNKPIIPVLNFSASPSIHLEAWRKILAERHLHAVIKYDSVAFYLEDEKRLYQSIQSLMPDHYKTISKLIKNREDASKLRLQMATSKLADLLIKASCTRLECRQYPPKETDSSQFEHQLRAIEKHCLSALLALYDFREGDLIATPLDIKNGRWQQDIFDINTLKEWGIETGTSALTGAAIGASIDLISAGLTLGTATAMGAILGATWQTGQHYKDTLKSKLTNRYYLCADNATLTLLCLRGLTTIGHLHQRGHASQHAYQITAREQNKELKTLIDKMKNYWKQAQQHPEWIDQELNETQPTKKAIIENLRSYLTEVMF